MRGNRVVPAMAAVLLITLASCGIARAQQSEVKKEAPAAEAPAAPADAAPKGPSTFKPTASAVLGATPGPTPPSLAPAMARWSFSASRLYHLPGGDDLVCGGRFRERYLAEESAE